MIRLREKIGYGLGDMSSSMFWKIFGAYLMVFYTDVFGLPAAVVGTMFALTRVWDSVFDPFMGVVADRTSTRMGKFRPYLLWLAVPFALMGVLTFVTPSAGMQGKMAYAYITYTLMMMVYSAVNVPYASLLGVISPDPGDRNVLATFRMVFAYVGSFVVLLLFMPLVNAFGDERYGGASVGWMTRPQFAWAMAVTVIAAVCALLFFGCFALTRERVRPVGGRHVPLRTDLRDLMHNRPWWILLGAGAASLIFNSIRDGATVYYFKYFIDESSFGKVTFIGIPFVLSSLYLAVGQAANIVGVIMAAPVSNRIGKRNTFMAAMALAALLSVVFWFLDKDELTLVFVLQILISVCAGSIFPLLWSMYADCADYSELMTGNRATGLIFSSSSMSQKLGWAVGTSLTGWMLGMFGFVPNSVQTPETIRGIRLFLSILPAAGAFASLMFMMFYPLSEKRMGKITAELKMRRG